MANKQRNSAGDNVSTWRDVLTAVLRIPGEKERIAKELSCHSASVTRWAQGPTTPAPQRLFALRDALPEAFQEEFSALLEQERRVQQYSGKAKESVPAHVPASVYDLVLDSWSQAPDVRRYWEVSRVILKHAVEQLDPGKVGMEISIVRCMPPTKHVVRSLREDICIGTSPWSEEVGYKSLLVGSESQAGYVVTTTLPSVIQDTEDPHGLVPLRKGFYKRSAAAYPIIRQGKIAGCLSAVCTLPKYFTAGHRGILQTYAKMCVLAFEPEDFFSSTQIDLREMPPDEDQLPFFAQFLQWRLDAIREADRKREHLSTRAAENRAWMRLEDALLDYTRQESERAEPKQQRDSHLVELQDVPSR